MKKYNIYFNDSVNDLAPLGTVDTLDEVRSFMDEELSGRMLVDDEHPCSDDVFATASVAQFEAYNGEPVILDEDEEVEDLKDPALTSPYFYTE